VIDTTTQKVIGEIVAGQGVPCGSASWGLDISPDGKTLYVLSSNDRCVLVADVQNQEFVGSFNVPVSEGSWLTHITVHPDGDKAYVLEQAGDVHGAFFDLYVYEAISDTQLHDIELVTALARSWSVPGSFSQPGPQAPGSCPGGRSGTLPALCRSGGGACGGSCPRILS
jgi:DNA-binding beta-propeller fold protein YncE